MPCTPPGRPTQNLILSEILRSLRRLRRLKARDMAAAMSMPLRSYEHFESAAGRINLERIQSFANASDTDPYAILAAMIIRSPRFALRAANNKMMTAFLITLCEFDESLGDGIEELETGAFVAAFTQAFETLQAEARQKASWKRTWLDSARKIAGATPKPPPDGESQP
jgi:transcriptional regulator with XRE-family HTH domain